MQRLIMDMPLMISAAIRHSADHHGKTEVVALVWRVNLDERRATIHRYDHATAHSRTQQLANALPRLGVHPGSRLFSLAWNTRRGCHLGRSQAPRHASIAQGTASLSMPASARPRSGDQLRLHPARRMGRDAQEAACRTDSNLPAAGDHDRLLRRFEIRKTEVERRAA